MENLFKDMTRDELIDLKFSLDQAIEDKTKQEYKEGKVKDIAAIKELLNFVKKHKKVKIDANIPVVIEYDLSPFNEYSGSHFYLSDHDHYIEDLEKMFKACDVYGYVKAGKGLKPGMKNFIDDHLESVELCPEGIKLFNPDLWKQMNADFKNFLKLKG